MEKDNRGVSLVELVAVMAIMAIMVTAVIAFMAAGVRQYQEARSEVSRQTEAQMVSNQLQDLLIDTANGINYNDTTKELWAYNAETEDGRAVYMATKINWNEAESKLYFSKYTYNPEMDGSYTPVEDSINQLLAENISRFQADLSSMETKNVITFTIEITLGGKSCTIDSVVTLRNKLKEVGDESEAFQDITLDLEPTVRNVVVTPSSAAVWQGGSYSGFNAVVNGVNYPAQDVAWSFSDATIASLTDPGTIIDSNSGIVTLGKNETCETLTIIATSLESKKDEPDSSKWVSGSASLSNKYVTGIQMGMLENTTDMSAQAELSVNGVNFEGNEDLANYISFEITDENGALVLDIGTSVRFAGEQSPGEKSQYIFRAAAPERYKGKTVTVTPKITYNENIYYGEPQKVSFKERKIVGLTLQMQDESGAWKDCGNTEYTAKRGETLSFRMKASYGMDGSSKVEYETYWLPGDSEWSRYLVWTVQKGGKITGDYGEVSELVNSGTFTIGGLSRFDAANKYSFSLNVAYNGSGDSVNSQNISIIIPAVSMSVLERHENQSKEFMTSGESQNIHFVVAGLDVSQYDIIFESVEGSVMTTGNVRISGDLAVLAPQKAGNGNVKFSLVDKTGTAIGFGSKEVSVTLPLEIGNKNMYVRTGGFGSYGYTLIESSMYIPAKNYSTKGNTAYTLSGIKVEYRTITGLFGTTKTVKINDGSTSYTGVEYNGENIWYR